MINKIVSHVKEHFRNIKCPQCSSRNTIKKNDQEKYIDNIDRTNYYCINCGMSFCTYH